jgi:hypothetical protein
MTMMKMERSRWYDDDVDEADDNEVDDDDADGGDAWNGVISGSFISILANLESWRFPHHPHTLPHTLIVIKMINLE